MPRVLGCNSGLHITLSHADDTLRRLPIVHWHAARKRQQVVAAETLARPRQWPARKHETALHGMEQRCIARHCLRVGCGVDHGVHSMKLRTYD
jgi:hypothetical protein